VSVENLVRLILGFVTSDKRCNSDGHVLTVERKTVLWNVCSGQNDFKCHWRTSEWCYL